MGAEAIQAPPAQLRPGRRGASLAEIVANGTGSASPRIKRLKVINAFRLTDTAPESMVLDNIPVIPPDLRPMVQLDGGRLRHLGPERPLPAASSIATTASSG